MQTGTKTLCTLADLGSLATSEAKCIKPVGTCAETTFRSFSRANITSALARMYESATMRFALLRRGFRVAARTYDLIRDVGDCDDFLDVASE